MKQYCSGTQGNQQGCTSDCFSKTEPTWSPFTLYPCLCVQPWTSSSPQQRRPFTPPLPAPSWVAAPELAAVQGLNACSKGKWPLAPRAWQVKPVYAVRESKVARGQGAREARLCCLSDPSTHTGAVLPTDQPRKEMHQNGKSRDRRQWGSHVSCPLIWFPIQMELHLT